MLTKDNVEALLADAGLLVGRAIPAAGTVDEQAYIKARRDDSQKANLQLLSALQDKQALEAENAELRANIARMTGCQDCGKAYGGDSWLDAVLPNDQWALIMGQPESKDDPGGILCANCILARAARLGRFVRARLVLE